MREFEILFLAVIPFSLIPLIFLINFKSPDDFGHSFAKGVVLTQGKDFLSTFAYIGIVLFSRRTKKTFSLINKSVSVKVGVSSIFGGPLGYTFYNTAFYMAGPSFGHIFTSLEPVFLALFAFFYLKRKFKWQMWLGILLTNVATISIVFGESVVLKSSENIIIGSLLGILEALCWTIEAVVFDRAITNIRTKRYNATFSLKNGIWSSLWISSYATKTGLIIHDVTHPYNYFSQFFSNPQYLWRFILAGVMIVLARLLFFNGMKYLGATYVNVIYSLTIITITIFNFIYYGISGDYIGGKDVLDSQLSLRFQLVFWIFVPFMVGGSIISTI